MRLKQYITELYMKDRGKKSIEILENPSKKEVSDVIRNSKGDSVKFIAYKKDIYLWDAYSSILHDDVWVKQGRDLEDDIADTIIFPGYAIWKGGKLVMNQVSVYLEDHLLDWDNEKVYTDRLDAFEKKFKWLNTFIDTSFLRRSIERNF
jgi:hypothetical protein